MVMVINVSDLESGDYGLEPADGWVFEREKREEPQDSNSDNRPRRKRTRTRRPRKQVNVTVQLVRHEPTKPKRIELGEDVTRD